MELIVGNIDDNWASIEEFCVLHHGSQTHSNRPYLEHLRDVVREVKRWQQYIPDDMLTTMIMAAYGHDLLEDTEASEDEVREVLGCEALTLIQAVTDSPGANRAARKKLTLPRTASNRLAAFLKLCDRLANIRISLKPTRYLEMYQKEHAEFRAALWYPGEYDSLWSEIEILLEYKH